MDKQRNKIIRNCIVALAAMLLTASCDPVPVRNGRSLYKQYYAKYLKDPSSFKIYKETFKQSSDIEVNWTLDYGAKNEYGGMVRKTVSFRTLGGSFIEFSNGDHFYNYQLE